MFLLAWIEGPESVRVAVFAAPFWAVILSLATAVICTSLYRVCRKEGGKVLSLDNKRVLVFVSSFCGLEHERDASATIGYARA